MAIQRARPAAQVLRQFMLNGLDGYEFPLGSLGEQVHACTKSHLWHRCGMLLPQALA
jgi:hypothetical protein